jgi:hypothetical protein
MIVVGAAVGCFALRERATEQLCSFQGHLNNVFVYKLLSGDYWVTVNVKDIH